MSVDSASMESQLLKAIAHPESVPFETLIVELHEFQLAANPDYAGFCASHPKPATWKEIPALPQDVFKRHAVRSFPAGATTRTFRTSGTTGEGYGEHHFQSLRLYREAALRGWELAGLGGREVLALLPSASEAPHSSLSQMASWLCREDSAFFVHGGSPEWERLENRLMTGPPAVVFGTALAFLGWMEHLDHRRLSLPDGIIFVETGGYKGSGREIPKTDLYAQLEETFGIPAREIVNEYGMTELSSQFYARGVGTPHARPPWARAVVIDPESQREVADGEIGTVRIFDAANLWSVCAIQTQDLAVRRGEEFELIGRDPAALPRGCSRSADEMLRHS